MKINNNKIKSLFLLSLVGSGLAKEEKSNNQSEITSNEINLNSLPQMGVNLTAGGNETEPTLVFAGMPIFFRGNSATNLNIDQRRCVSSFTLVLPEVGDCQWQGFNGNLKNNGFLTSARCCQSGNCGANFAFLLLADNPQQDHGSNAEAISRQNVGRVVESTFFYKDVPPMTDRTFVLVYDEGLKLIPYVAGKKDLLPIIGLGSAALGSEVCAYGAISGYLCGKVVEVDASLEIPNPDQGGSTTLAGLNKVDLGENGFEYEADLGGPVYTVSNISDRTVAQALGHISSIDYSDSQHKFFYYTSLDAVLKDLVEYAKCSYSLLTYNETKALEHD